MNDLSIHDVTSIDIQAYRRREDSKGRSYRTLTLVVTDKDGRETSITLFGADALKGGLEPTLTLPELPEPTPHYDD